MGKVSHRLIAPISHARYLLVVPVYDPGESFFRFLPELCGVLGQSASRFRIQVVDDGCDESVASRITRFVEDLDAPGVKVSPVLPLAANSGKGAAVYTGWRTGVGESWYGFVDCDGSVPAAEVLRLALLAEEVGESTVVLASRQPAPNRMLKRRTHRHLLGRCFAAAVRLGIGLDVHDTQCGLKWVPATGFRNVAQILSESRFAFDVDLLATMKRSGYRLREESISWADTEHSTVRLWRDIPAMAASLLRLTFKFRFRSASPVGSSPKSG
ncbi:MAG: glycosyltransferase [Opitutaceae bacterium]|nr:glycosyltransferase [Opitutaceae bacterium]